MITPGQAEKADKMERVFERMDKNVERLKTNLSKIQRETLIAKYPIGYKKVTDEILTDADSWAKWRWDITVDGLKRDPQDLEGNAELARKANGIIAVTRWNGGAVERYQAALIEHLDVYEYLDIVDSVVDDICEKAFRPYWKSHCHTLTNGVIWNDIWGVLWSEQRKGWVLDLYKDDGYFFPLFPP